MSNVSDDVSIHRHKALLTENLIFKYVNVSKVYVWETPGVYVHSCGGKTKLSGNKT